MVLSSSILIDGGGIPLDRVPHQKNHGIADGTVVLPFGERSLMAAWPVHTVRRIGANVSSGQHGSLWPASSCLRPRSDADGIVFEEAGIASLIVNDL